MRACIRYAEYICFLRSIQEVKNGNPVGSGEVYMLVYTCLI